MKKTLKSHLNLPGVLTITNYEISGQRAEELDRILQSAENMSPERYSELVSELRSLCKVTNRVVHNMVVKAGRSVFAQRLGGTTTYSGTINYGCLGTSSTAVADTDTQLGTEVKRKQVATIVIANDQTVLDFYFSKADTNGTYEEFGCVIDGTSSANTGQLYDRALTGGWTKTNLEAMTVSIQFNFNAA